ncbi:MAG: TIR domain-containing protein [Clostridiales bacterium]|nr:TIR domain-containing protein [Clostridiales bacterium]
MEEKRTYLKTGTQLQFDSGSLYEITGDPIGRGGGSLIYPAKRYVTHGDRLDCDGMIYALKECYPSSLGHRFIRDEQGEIVPETRSEADAFYLACVKRLQLDEQAITQWIYRTGSRILPVLESAEQLILAVPGQEPTLVRNTVTVMESLASKGRSLHSYMEEYQSFTPLQTFHVIRQILFALREIHEAGFLHLDIQDGNVFIKGALDDESSLVTMIDFGSARAMVHGKTERIADRVIFTTEGFSAPEILLHNDGSLRLGPEADLYSVGCLILYLLTGSKYSANALLSNQTGKYLSRFKLRKIDCPAHLQERMQTIIARALKIDPSERYHSVDEMLEDVRSFLNALQPNQNNLELSAYDAFVCYKHGPIDSEVARVLRKRLEHFRAPKSMGTGTGSRSFRHVFVDEGELSSCADFGEQIRTVLKNSEWLIVICSPDTPRSSWVRLEIDTFLEYHDRSRILAVLTGGEPAESFPPQLQGQKGTDMVLAADARGKNRREVLSRLKRDALLRIAAPMLSTTYSALKRHHRILAFRQIAAASVSVIVISGVLILSQRRPTDHRPEMKTETVVFSAQPVTQEAEQAAEEEAESEAETRSVSVSSALHPTFMGYKLEETGTIADQDGMQVKNGILTLKREDGYYVVSESGSLSARGYDEIIQSLGNGWVLVNQSDPDLDSVGLVNVEGGEQISCEAAYIEWLKNSINQEDAKRYLKVVYGTGTTTDISECFFYKGKRLPLIRIGSESYPDCEDIEEPSAMLGIPTTSTMYTGYARIYDVENKQFVDVDEITNHEGKACGSGFTLVDADGTTNLYGADGTVRMKWKKIPDVGVGYLIAQDENAYEVYDDEGTFLFSSAAPLSLMESTSGLIKIYKDEKWGLVDRNGNQVLPASYRNITEEQYGVVNIRTEDDGYALVDLEGNVLASSEDSFTSLGMGYYYAKSGESYMLAGPDGIVAENLDNLPSKACVTDGSTALVLKDKTFSLQLQGERTVSLGTGLIAAMSDTSGKWGVYDLYTGTQLLDYSYAKIESGDGYLYARQGENWFIYKINPIYR